jgi:hypothetical protein
MKGNLYQHIKIRHAYDFSLCFPHELLMSFWNLCKALYLVNGNILDVKSKYNYTCKTAEKLGQSKVNDWMYQLVDETDTIMSVSVMIFLCCFSCLNS